MRFRIFFLLIAVVIALSVKGEAMKGDTVVPLGAYLENYNYAYPVKYITLDIQRQALKMAYMDIQPCYEFDKIRAPTLLIIGQLDRTALGKNLVPDSVRQTMGNYPVLGRATQAKIPNCRLVELPGIGHVPHVEDFDQFIRAVSEFLNG